MKTNITHPERRIFFKKAGLSAMGAGLLSALPFGLFSQPKKNEKNSEQNISNSITINPMAVKREKRK